MEILRMEQRSEEWLAARKGKVTGSRLKDLIPTGGVAKADVLAELEKRTIPHKKTMTIAALMELLPADAQSKLERTIPRKLEFYKLLAEKIAFDQGDQKPMDRGIALEDEAIAKIEEKLDVKIEQVGMCVHATIPDIAVSPDGLIKSKKHNKYYEAVEVKCRNTEYHLKALLEKKIPDDYRFQILQYFIVIDTLEVLHFCLYDPCVVGHELITFEVHRDEVREDVEQYEAFLKKTVAEINELATELTNF